MIITHAHKHTVPTSYQQGCAKGGLRACVPLCACVCVYMCAGVMLFFSPNVPLNSHQVAVLSWISEAREGGDGR